MAEDDEDAYGAEEEEEEAAQEVPVPHAEGEDSAMDGAEEVAQSHEVMPKEQDEVSEAGSEDLEAESSGSDEDDEEEGDAEAEVDDEMDMAEDVGGNTDSTAHEHTAGPQLQHQDVMVH